MSRAKRLEKLERQRTPSTPALLFLTPDGLRDAHNRLVDGAPQGVKVLVGVDPRDI
jgi:hypothetical protein